MSDRTTIEALLADGTRSMIDVEVATTPQPVMVLVGDDGTSRRFEGKDLFEALTAARSFLEAGGVRLLCNGARVDCYPSGMSRSMSLGRKAYIMRLGERPGPNDIVDILSAAEAEAIGTVEQQSAFHDAWKASLR